MSDAKSTLLAVVVGGTLTAGGSIVADWLKSKREQSQSERERLRENLYGFQDSINEVFNAYQVAVESKNGHGAPWTQQSNAQLSNAIRRLVMLCGSIGDSQIDALLTNVLLNLRESHHSSDPIAATAMYEEAASAGMVPLSARIEELLHTDSRVDRRFGPLTSEVHLEMRNSAERSSTHAARR